MLKRSARKRMPTATSIGQAASARRKVMRSSPPTVTSKPVLGCVTASPAVITGICCVTGIRCGSVDISDIYPVTPTVDVEGC
jgi:hypothetical protein